MKKIYTLTLCLVTTLLIFTFNAQADTTRYLDFKIVLNKSVAGASAQKTLQSKFNSEAKKFTDIEKKLKKEEKELIAKKKLITKDEYQKNVQLLRNKVSELNKNKNISFKKLSDQRSKAKADLIAKLNPIVKKYMTDNKINLVLNKNSVLLGADNLDITKSIIELLNKQLKSLKIN